MKRKLVITVSGIIIISLLTYCYIDYIYSGKSYISDNNVQNSMGINIHFVNPNQNETKKIYNAGFKTIRMDIVWSSIEKNKGVYDFSQYDKLVNELDKNKMNILFILDYSNPLYDNGLAPYSDYGREAFSNFSRAVVKHYRGKSIMWEIWNEPNVAGAWKPKPSVENYYKLAMNTITVIKSVDRNAFIIAPALAGLDHDYLDYLGKNDFFKYIDAVSIHPYRKNNPETVIGDYNKIKDLIYKYPHKEDIKLFCGEWGYSTAWKDIDETKQAQYAVREYLTNLMCGISLTILYDWKDDGTDKKNMEHNFGCVYNNLEPKKSYYAITTLTDVLKDYKFIKRMDDGADSDYILMFKKGSKTAYALWTTEQSHQINVRLNSDKIRVVDFTGTSYERKIIDNLYKIDVSNSVIYITDID